MCKICHKNNEKLNAYTNVCNKCEGFYLFTNDLGRYPRPKWELLVLFHFDKLVRYFYSFYVNKFEHFTIEPTIKEICNQAPAMITYITLPTYGKVDVKRMEELKRRVFLGYDKTKPGEYFVGRRGENGKIQEKTGDISK